MTVLIALAAATVYGAADFFGGFASRRAAATAVLVISQLIGLAFLAALVPIVGTHFYASDVAIGALAGAAAAVGIGLLYAALAAGRMGVVSPITAVVSACVPVVVSLVTGERISALATAGCVLALVAVVLVSAGGGDSPGAQPARAGLAFLREPGVGLALGSGLAIGGLYVALAHGHADGRLAIVGEMRFVSIPLLAVFALVTKRPLAAPRAALPVIALAGVLDMLANVLYVLAARTGPLAVAAVVTSLYPASTVVLAFVILHERLSPVQVGGVATALAGVVLIAL